MGKKLFFANATITKVMETGHGRTEISINSKSR